MHISNTYTYSIHVPSSWRFTSGARKEFSFIWFVWIWRIWRRPFSSGRFISTWTSNRPGLHNGKKKNKRCFLRKCFKSLSPEASSLYIILLKSKEITRILYNSKCDGYWDLLYLSQEQIIRHVSMSQDVSHKQQILLITFVFYPIITNRVTECWEKINYSFLETPDNLNSDRLQLFK